MRRRARHRHFRAAASARRARNRRHAHAVRPAHSSFRSSMTSAKTERSAKKVLILGVNGFIGHHLSKRILETTDWEVFGMDMQTDRLGDLINHERMHFFEGDITINKEWVEYHIRKCDVI